MIKNKYSYIISKEKNMISFGKKISKTLSKGDIIYFYGELGAGKTTLIRSILQNLILIKNIKSPTYTIVEIYNSIKNSINLYHFDFYRINQPAELESIGIQEYFDNESISFIEWPDKGKDVIPSPTKVIKIEYALKNNERIVTFYSYS